MNARATPAALHATDMKSPIWKTVDCQGVPIIAATHFLRLYTWHIQGDVKLHAQAKVTPCRCLHMPLKNVIVNPA